MERVVILQTGLKYGAGDSTSQKVTGPMLQPCVMFSNLQENRRCRILRTRCGGCYGLADARTELRVNVVPVLERTFTNLVGTNSTHVTRDIADQAFAFFVVHGYLVEGARLREIIVVRAQGVGGAYQLAIRLPATFASACRIRMRRRWERTGR